MLVAIPIISAAVELAAFVYFEFFTTTGWLIMIIYWPLYVIGASAAIIAIAKYRSWLLVLPLLMLLTPLLAGSVFLYQCSQGNCI